MSYDELIGFIKHNRFKKTGDPVKDILLMLYCKRCEVQIELNCAEEGDYTPKEWTRSERNLLDQLVWRIGKIMDEYE